MSRRERGADAAGRIVDVDVTDLGHAGEGVGRLEGKAVFIPGALPGERVRARLVEQKPRYARGQLVEVTTPSPDRVQPPCPHYAECGGCQLQHLSEPAQARAKEAQVRAALARIGGIEAQVRPILSGEALGYRHKAQFPAAAGGAGRLELGFYAPRSHELVPIDECAVQDPVGRRAYRHVREVLREFKAAGYDEHGHRGWLRHVLIRTSRLQRQALVVLVALREQPRLHDATPATPEWLSRLAEAIGAAPEVGGVFLNLNPERTNVILGPRMRHLAGAERLIEELDGLRFWISPASFFQVNPQQAEVLYQQALQAAALRAGDTCVDLYCGTGTIALFMARRLAALGAGNVLGVERVREAIADAEANAALNKLEQVTFWRGSAAEAARRLAQAGRRVDVCVVDPPRKGCEPEVIETVAAWRCRRFVYVSCNPATLARDLGLLLEREPGYRVESVQPVDLFAQTAHVEVVAALSFSASASG